MWGGRGGGGADDIIQPRNRSRIRVDSLKPEVSEIAREGGGREEPRCSLRIRKQNQHTV
ncbi:hypothetical protein SK128_001970 [Halocaridina rubra]|uniref:Uncharacterized protein n=1 Tax=Halocaridina rubra TaxID=373956 RepID=A0AAN9ACM8_HALRR